MKALKVVGIVTSIISVISWYALLRIFGILSSKYSEVYWDEYFVAFDKLGWISFLFLVFPISTIIIGVVLYIKYKRKYIFSYICGGFSLIMICSVCVQYIQGKKKISYDSIFSLFKPKLYLVSMF